MSVERIRNSCAGLSHSKVDALDHYSRSNEMEAVCPLVRSTGECAMRGPWGLGVHRGGVGGLGHAQERC